MTDEPTDKWELFGDFSRFVIKDRIGQSIEYIPNVGTVPYSKGSSGLYKWWRSQPNSGGTA